MKSSRLSVVIEILVDFFIFRSTIGFNGNKPPLDSCFRQSLKQRVRFVAGKADTPLREKVS
jgi:hypothetical protein